jgi:L-alanine-DL-glutamate epimerase-like enolase superfamily enzyme
MRASPINFRSSSAFMQIEAVELHLLRIPFKQAFGHAITQRTAAETVIVLVRSAAGTVGVGEIVPRSYLTGETIDSVLGQSGPARARRCQGRSLSSKDEVVTWLRAELADAGRELATLGGFELAVLDLAGQELGFPAGDAIGGARGPALPPGVVIGFDVKTPDLKKHCMMLRMTGRRHVKVKVGRPDDLERLDIIARGLGADTPLRLDANAAWSADEAVARLGEMRGRFAIESVEQPVAAADLAGMRRVRRETGIKVMADEALCTLADGHRLIDAEAVDVFNVRVGKCGGLLGSLRLCELAKSAGLGLHLGALVGETAVLSRAAEIFGRAVPGFACLEGKGQNRFLLQGDIADLVEGEDNAAAPGLGITLRPDWLARYEDSPPAPTAR